MGIKFYKENNQYVLGDSALDYKPAGTFTADVHGDFLAIVELGTGIKRFDYHYSAYEDSTSTPYASISALMAAISGFFASSSSNTQLVDSSGNVVTPSSSEPRTLYCEYTRPANTTARPANGAINETVSVIKELLDSTGKHASNINGGGGVVINGSIVSNNTSDVGRQFGIIFLREDISPIIADNAVQTILYANQGKRIMVVYATMEAQSAGSDMVIGRFNLPFEYQCKADSKALKVLIFDVTGGTTVSGSKYMVTVNVQVQK